MVSSAQTIMILKIIYVGKRAVMDTSLSDIIKAHMHYYYLMMQNAWVHQSAMFKILV